MEIAMILMQKQNVRVRELKYAQNASHILISFLSNASQPRFHPNVFVSTNVKCDQS